MSEPTYRIAQALHERRAAVGLQKYGEHLTADSPGCMIVHALEEAADLTEYLLTEVQRRREAITALCALRAIHGGMVPDNDTVADISHVIDLLGGEAALARYDEILATVAQDATVATDPRDEALRVATKLVEKLDAVHNDPKYGRVWVVHQQHCGPYSGLQYDGELDELKAALAAIRGAR